MSTRNNFETRQFLEDIIGSPVTLGSLLGAIRKGEGQTLEQFAARIGISRQRLCDIEKGRRFLGPKKAAFIAEILGESRAQFVRLALQGSFDFAGLDIKVEKITDSRLKKSA